MKLAAEMNKRVVKALKDSEEKNRKYLLDVGKGISGTPLFGAWERRGGC
jgi:hypothetical protein